MFYFYFDYICPYSYLVSERLHLLELDYFEKIERRGIGLQTHLPAEGIPLSPEKEVEIKREIEDIRSLKDGEEIELSLPPVDPNTKNALAATLLAGQNGCGWEFHREVYRAYWRDGKNIGLIPVLQEVAERIGWNGDNVIRLRENDTIYTLMDDHLKDFRKLGIRGVPTIDFDGRAVKGVRTYEEYKKLLLDTLWDQEVYDCSCE
jgi:predicted DsbA family dithiol-disulfide isomerase